MNTTWKSGKTGKTSTGVTLGLVGWRRIWNRQEKLIVRLHAFINHWTNSWPVEYSCDQVFWSHGTTLTVPKFKCQNSGQSFSWYNKRIWPVWCEHNDHLFEQQSRCPMWTEWKDWAVSCKVLSQIFKLVENLSGALWRTPQWHNKNYQVHWKFCVSLCAKPLLWGGSYSLLATLCEWNFFLYQTYIWTGYVGTFIPTQWFAFKTI